MWLDGLYMGQPFYTEYASLMHEDTAFNDVARQFILMEKHARDQKTGLLYHGYDESREQKWADKKTGLSPHFWGRAMGWYAMALVDVLDYFPASHPKRDSITAILKRLATAVQKFQDPKSGVWYQVLDKGTSKGNYLEASASNMFVYALAKGVRKGYLPESYQNVARKGYDGIIKQFIKTDEKGQVNLHGTVSVAGLGGTPYRDGSYEYYLSEKVIVNDPKGVGAFLLAANEMEISEMAKPGKGKTVTLDNYFNKESLKSLTGFTEPFHYIWEEKDNNGFHKLGEVFSYRGTKLATLPVAPDANNLKNTQLYIIVDPDTRKENPTPNYIGVNHIKAITDWVKAGGVLLLMGNDSGNMEFANFNHLGESFGIEFKVDSKNRVTGSNYEMGKIMIAPGHEIFKNTKQIYIKELSPLNLTPPARAVMTHNGDIVIGVAKLGKGTVFAVGDPWLYNEYTDGRKLPAEYENYKAAEDLVDWLLKQSK
jgi:unsaturated rhamnogalacturonyl hydrolase